MNAFSFYNKTVSEMFNSISYHSIMLLNYIEFTYELLPFLNSNKSNGLFSLLDYYNNNYNY